MANREQQSRLDSLDYENFASVWKQRAGGTNGGDAPELPESVRSRIQQYHADLADQRTQIPNPDQDSKK
jgi:hypothetical protein